MTEAVRTPQIVIGDAAIVDAHEGDELSFGQLVAGVPDLRVAQAFSAASKV